MCVCVLVRVFKSVYRTVHTHLHLGLCIYLHTHTYIQTDKQTNKQANVTYIQTYKHTNIHTRQHNTTQHITCTHSNYSINRLYFLFPPECFHPDSLRVTKHRCATAARHAAFGLLLCQSLVCAGPKQNGPKFVQIGGMESGYPSEGGGDHGRKILLSKCGHSKSCLLHRQALAVKLWQVPVQRMACVHGCGKLSEWHRT